MLTDNGQKFTTGLCRYQDDLAENQSTPSKLFIPIRIGDLPGDLWAMVDTGAPYCIFEAEVLEALGYRFDPALTIPLSTRLGQIRGTPHNITLTVLANEGDSLAIESTFLVPETMPHAWKGNFIGYAGCLQRFCFAVDPSKNFFHFGKYPDT